MDEVAKAVSSEAAVHYAEDLTQKGGRRGVEGRVEACQSFLDAAIQRLRVLEADREINTGSVGL